jgi:inner membrane transporter RhtA
VGVRTGPVLPAGLVLAGAVSVQSGAGIADRLFGQLPPASVTTLRLWSAALILLVVAGRGTSRAVAGLAARRAWTDGVIALTFGIALGFMNFAIYQAFARIPLGIAVTIEFLGPLTVTVAGTLRGSAAGAPGGRHRRAAGLGCAALAAGGVALLAGTAGGMRLNWAGVAWAAAAGTAWAAYILGSKAAGQRLPGASGLVIAMCVAAVAVTAPGVIAGAPKMFRPSFLAAGAGIGLLSSVIPYWLELEALRRIPTSLFGVWMSVQPAVAALIGLAVLGQRLSPAEWAGICCVAAASAGAAGSTRAPDNPAGPGGSGGTGASRWPRFARRERGDLRPRPRAELREDPRNVGADRVAGQEQLGGDLRIGPAVGDQPGDLGLGRGQRLPPVS